MSKNSQFLTLILNVKSSESLYRERYNNNKEAARSSEMLVTNQS